jgi:trichodiene synthase
LEILKDKDPDMLATIRGFIHGYATWHICDFRYRLREIYDREDLQGSGARFREYFDKAIDVGWVDVEEWTCPVQGFEVDGPAPTGSEIQAYQTNAFAFSVDTLRHHNMDYVGSSILGPFEWVTRYLRGKLPQGNAKGR